MQNEKEFTPTSKRFHFIDRYQKAYKNTGISYQFGKLNGRKAVQLFYNGDLTATRFKTQKYRSNTKYFDIQAYGGQDMNSAQMQRERTLQVIVQRYFESLGFKVEIEPKLDDFTPDVLITKDNLRYYIELKAYHRHNICGDPEIAQTMKYFEKTHRLIEAASENNSNLINRSILFTSTDLIAKDDSCLSHPDKDPEKFVKNFYKPRVMHRKYVNTMDKFTAKMMYIHAEKKFKSNSKIGFRDMNVLFPEDVSDEDFPEIFFNTAKYDVLLLDYNLIYQLLTKGKFKTEAHYLKLLRETKLEKLVLNKEILEL
ncbi:MAG: hypothetical protein ACTSR8_20215 [Promethearchaeota archaeon]